MASGIMMPSVELSPVAGRNVVPVSGTGIIRDQTALNGNASPNTLGRNAFDESDNFRIICHYLAL